MSLPENQNGPTNGYFLGIDGGGTKTLAVVVDEHGTERGRARAGSSNYAAVGLELVVSHIFEAAREAARGAGTELPVAGAWLGLAGVDSLHAHALLLPHVQGLAENVRLTNDAELVLGGLAGAVGVALIAGTGSIALGRDARGEARRAGGWGHVLGDEGSGYDIGHRALQAVMRAADGRGEATALLPVILREWGLAEARDILERVYPELDKAVIARLSPLVLRTAAGGDRVASEIVRGAAEELALAASAVGQALGFDSTPLPLALGGGLLLHEHAFREEVLQALRRRQELGVVALVEEPALSAARTLAQG